MHLLSCLRNAFLERFLGGALVFICDDLCTNITLRSVQGAWGGLLAGNMMTTKASVEMIKCECTFTCLEPHTICDRAVPVRCVTLNWGDADAAAASGCAHNPFLTPWPYLFITTSLALACGALYLLAVGLRSFEGVDCAQRK